MGANNVKRFEFRLGKWGLGLFVCGMSLLVFLSFLFGVMVGKDLDAYPEKYSWGIARQLTGSSNSVKSPEIPKAVVAVREAGKERNENAEYDLSFYETLSKKRNNLKTQPSGDEHATQSHIEQPAPSGEGMTPLPAAPPVHTVGLLPGNKPLPEKKRVVEEKEKEASRPDKSAAVLHGEEDKKPGSKANEKHIETRLSEKKALHQKEKNITAEVKERKTDPKISKNFVERQSESKPGKNVAEKKNDQKLKKSITTENKADAKPEKRSVEKRSEPKSEKGAAAERKQGKKTSVGKEVKKGEQKQNPEKKKYMAQVASYREKAKADQVAGKLRAMGYAPHVVPMELPGKGRWYRITISGLQSHDKAKEALSNVEKKIGGSKGFVRPEGEEMPKVVSGATITKKKTSESENNKNKEKKKVTGKRSPDLE